MLSELLIHHPKLRLLVDLWREARASDSLPNLSDIDPVTLGAELLPFVWIIRGSSADDYHLSLIGEEIRTNFAESPVGKPLRDVLKGPIGAKMFDRVCQVFERQQGHFSQGPMAGTAGRRYLGTRIMLPVADDATGPGATAVIGGFEKLEEKKRLVLLGEDINTPLYSLETEHVFTVAELGYAVDRSAGVNPRTPQQPGQYGSLS
jgi:hypothetical protein